MNVSSFTLRHYAHLQEYIKLKCIAISMNKSLPKTALLLSLIFFSLMLAETDNAR